MLFCFQHGCTSATTPKDNFPSQKDFPDYELIDARYTENLILNVKKNKKIAIVVKDLSTTAFSNLEKPFYDKNFVSFSGSKRCCLPTEPLMGASGLRVYRFHFLEKSGKTIIKIIARHKGLSPTAEHFDSDIVTKVDVTAW